MPDETFELRSAIDGMSLGAYVWNAPHPPRGTVVIAHGAAEHALRYERFARALNRAGFEVRALDHRGHGRSLGPLGLGDMGEGGWDALVADLGQFVVHSRSLRESVPVVLFGHSMGSFAAQQFCCDGSSAIEALVLSGSTAWEAPRDGAPRARFAPNAAFEPARTPYDWLSRDPVEVDKYIADPLCGFESQRARRPPVDYRRLGDETALRRIRSTLPVLLVAGDADPINRELEGLRLLERRWRDAGVRRIDRRYYEGGRHEMLNETNREQVTRDIVTWLEEVLSS